MYTVSAADLMASALVKRIQQYGNHWITIDQLIDYGWAVQKALTAADVESTVYRSPQSIRQAAADWPDYFEVYSQEQSVTVRAKMSESALVCHFTPAPEVALVMSRVPLPPLPGEWDKCQATTRSVINQQRERLERLDYLEREVKSLTAILRALQLAPDTSEGKLTVQHTHVGFSVTKQQDTVDLHISVLKEIEPVLQRLKVAREAELRNLYLSFGGEG